MLTTHLVSARARVRVRGRSRGWVRVGVGVGVSADDALVSRVADVRALGLRGLAHGLHDVVALRLVVEVLLHEGERVIQRLRPRQARVRVGLLLAHALYHVGSRLGSGYGWVRVRVRVKVRVRVRVRAS